MIQYRFDIDANRIYAEYAAGVLSTHHAHSLERLLPLTKPSFTVLVDLSELTPEHLTHLVEDHLLMAKHGVRRCAFLASDSCTLGILMKKLRKRGTYQIERGYFTRTDDALAFLMEEKVECAF
ncbi:hypothetical protein [Tumebacillus lipolyticus]|uniref:STAS domain-containing protein n=1 Tax=Tumebacillus lipolyticus TaxID=1280370 RepID=A0ABW5A0C2_9BACL